MARLLRQFLLLVLLSTSVEAAESKEPFYTVGVVPQFDARKLHSIWRPILAHLERETGYKFKMRGSPTIPDFETEFIAGNFDFAYMNPYHLVLANEAAGYVPLVRDHSRQLFGVLVVRTDSNITDLKALQDKPVAFPSPNALGASLLVRQELHEQYGVTVKPRYVKTHDSVYLNVLLGEAVAGGGVQKTLNRQKPEYREALKVIHKTKMVSPHPLAALPSVPKEVREAVQRALFKLGENEEGKGLLAKIPIKQIGVASMEDYQLLKNMGLERFSSQMSNR